MFHTPANSSPEITPEVLRRALRAWDSTKQLGEQPLVSMGCVAAQHRAAGYSETTAGWGLALRETLQAAIQALQPGAGAFDPADKRWRPYFILTEQYLQARAPEWVAEQLCISRRTYYNEQEAALEAVADLLRQREAAAGQRPAVVSAPESRPPFLAPPRSAQGLVGRQALFQDLKTRLLTGKPGWLALYGLPGVGKSSLALELAHDPEILSAFSDGILWAGLGRAPDLPALLGSWAAALGLPPEAIRPSNLAASARALHAALGMRRMLLVIDDAWELEAALTFRLGGPNCALLLTTRLGPLAFDFAGEQALRLEELPADEGLTLLGRAAPQAVASQPEKSAALVAAVGGLPLALVLMGRQLRKLSFSAQAQQLAAALEQLQQAQARFALCQPQALLEQRSDLPAETPLSLQTMIGLSEAALPPAARLALRALALFPPKPNTFSETAALAVAGTEPAALEALCESGLLEPVLPGRGTLHQTVSDYARLQGTPVEAQARYLAYFAGFATAQAADFKSLDLELNNLLTALTLAGQSGALEPLRQTSHSLHAYLMSRGFYRQNEVNLQRLAELALQAGNAPALAQTLSYLGIAKLRQGEYAGAQGVLQTGLEQARALGNLSVEAECQHSLGNIAYYRGEYPQAVEALQAALGLFRQLSNLDGQARALITLGLVDYEQGFFPEATAHLQQALETSRQGHNRDNEGIALSNLGLLLADQGNYSQAVAYHYQALELCRASGSLRLEASILENLSFALTQLGSFAEAKASYQRALQIFRQIGNQPGLATGQAFLAGLLQLMGDAALACDYASQALDLARHLEDAYTCGVALTVLGHARTELGQFPLAVEAYREAVALWRESSQPNLAADPLAGLARLNLQLGDLAAAGEHTVEILAVLETHSLDGSLDAHWIWLTCVQVLQAADDPRAAAVLERAYRLTLEQAAKIDDLDLRRSFLEKLPARREIIALYRQTQSETPAKPPRRRPVLA